MDSGSEWPPAHWRSDMMLSSGHRPQQSPLTLSDLFSWSGQRAATAQQPFLFWLCVSHEKAAPPWVWLDWRVNRITGWSGGHKHSGTSLAPNWQLWFGWQLWQCELNWKLLHICSWSNTIWLEHTYTNKHTLWSNTLNQTQPGQC